MSEGQIRLTGFLIPVEVQLAAALPEIDSVVVLGRELEAALRNLQETGSLLAA